MDRKTIEPAALRFARRICYHLPPIVSQRVRTFIYDQRRAYADAYEFVVRSQTGSLFQHRTDDFHGYPFSVHGYYEWRNWAIAVSLCTRGDTIVEIGANIGTETIGFADIVGPTGYVVAFEPLPSNVTSLRALYMLNNVNHVEVIEAAVSDCCDVRTFRVPSSPSASGIGYLSDHTRDLDDIEVACTTLDTLNLPSPKLIVMDIEGAEVEVLRGGQGYILAHRPYMVLEASPKLLERAGSDIRHLYGILNDLDYIPYQIGRIRLKKVRTGEFSSSSSNWLCLPREKDYVAKQVGRTLLKSACLPCLRGVNPISRG